MKKSNKQFALYIKGGKGYQLKKFDKYILTSYEEICTEINKINSGKDNLEKNDIKPVEIYLNHKKIEKKIIIYNKEEWNFLYNYNIINECISNSNKLKIDYKIIDASDKIDENAKNENFSRIISYIMTQIPQNFYFKILFKFFDANEEVGKLFQKFFLNKLKNTNLDELNNKKQGVRDSLLLNKKNDSQTFNENEYSLKTNEFLKTYKSQILRFKNTIMDIIEEGDDKNNDNNNNIIKTVKTDINDNIIKDEFIDINKSDIIPENNNIYFTILEKEIDEKKYVDVVDNKKYFKKLKMEEYYLGIEEIKDKLKREILSL